MKIFQKDCFVCGQSFETSSGKAKYCSGRCCQSEWQKTSQKNRSNPRPCAICGNTFSPLKKNAGAKFCSAKCRQEDRRVLFPKPCVVCGKEFQPYNKGSKSCSIECRGVLIGQSNRTLRPRIDRACKHCGKSFQVCPSELNDKTRTGEYCSRECARTVHFADRVVVGCAHCGIEISKTERKASQAKKHYCSRDCMNAAIEAERELIKCPECSKVFQAKKARNRRFCSASCKGIYMIRTGAFGNKPTTIEIAIDEVLKNMGVIYVSQFSIGRYVCDFYVPASNLVIECDGDYWHSRPEMITKDRRKDAFLAMKGYKLLRLPEYKIRNHLESCVEEIKERVFLSRQY